MLALLLLLAPAQAQVCESFGARTSRPAVTGPTEASGLARSRTRPDTWFTHDDSGGKPQLYAFDLDGHLLDTHVVVGAEAVDWEDLSAGPCPAGADAEHCLYIADIGDNRKRRERFAVYVVAEPAAGAAAPVLRTLWARYPDHAHDAEALAVHPCTGRVYLVTKDGKGPSMVFRFPVEPGTVDAPAVLEPVASVDIGRLAPSHGSEATAAEWNDGGDRLVVRTYLGALIWRTDPAAPELGFASVPVRTHITVTGQGEGIAWAEDGSLVTVEEGSPMTVGRTICLAPDVAPACPR